MKILFLNEFKDAVAFINSSHGISRHDLYIIIVPSDTSYNEGVIIVGQYSECNYIFQQLKCTFIEMVN